MSCRWHYEIVFDPEQGLWGVTEVCTREGVPARSSGFVAPVAETRQRLVAEVFQMLLRYPSGVLPPVKQVLPPVK